MATIEYRQASRIYDQSRPAAVNRMSLTIDDGELLVLVGPSGSGKSTAMRMLAGLEPIDEGAVLIDGKDVSETRARDRDVAMVFQSYALYPNMTARQNMAFALENARLPRAVITAKVDRAAEMLELGPLLDKKPSAMSGGQRQRVAMGRSIVRDPKVFCLDEPLSNLDAKLRVSTRAQIASLQRELGVTTVYVTHDQTEAMTMGDRVAVLKDGVLQQVDDPTHLYDHPGNTFVAGFIGSPGMTLLDGVPVRDGRAQLGGATDRDGRAVLDGGPARDGRARPDGTLDLGLPREPAARAPGTVIVGVRPEAWQVVGTGEGPRHGALPVRVALVERLGAEAFAYGAPLAPPGPGVSVRGGRLAIRLDRTEDQVHPGQTLHVRPAPGACSFFDPVTEVNLEHV